MIDDIWEWECVDELATVAKRSRVEALDVAAKSPCVCGGAWLSFVMSSMLQNKINVAELCHDVLGALKGGRSENQPVIVLTGESGGEGKSMFLKPLHRIYEGFVFGITKEAGNFPLLVYRHVIISLLTFCQ